MNKGPVHSVCFSPAGTTRIVTKALCRETGRCSGIDIDLNHPVGGTHFFAMDVPVVVAMPVYGGRLLALAVERFKSSGQPALQAGNVMLPKIYEIAERLHANCQTRREPEWFPVQP